jgi:hypothetical protein
MENNCIYSANGKITLSSSLKEQNFGRTDLGKLLYEKGTLAEVSSDGILKCADWSFDGTRTLTDGTVCFEGKCQELFSLTDLLKNTETLITPGAKDSISKDSGAKTEDYYKQITAVFKVLDDIIKNGIFDEDSPAGEKTVLPGPAGIFVSKLQSDGAVKVLVLPGLLFERCIENSKNYDEIQGLYNNRNLDGLEAALFTRAACAYYALSGKTAFEETSFEKRQEDFTDENFMPLSYRVNGIPAVLALSVDSGLRLKRKKRIIPGEKKYINEKQELRRLTELKNAQALNSSMLEEYFKLVLTCSLEKTDEKEFALKKLNFEKRQKKIIKTARFYKHNSKRIRFIIAGLILAFWAGSSFYRTNQRLATSTGLTSKETVLTLMTAINSADVTIVQEITAGREIKSLIQAVAGFYVTNKQRLAMDEKNGTLSPAEWLFFKGETDFWQYGITNLTVDGEYGTTAFNYPRRKDKKQPLKTEDGRLLKKGEETTHQITYDLVHYDGDNVIAVNSAEETVTLRWNGKKWLVRSVKGKQKAQSFKVKTYKEDYISALEESGGNISKAAQIMREKYYFAPSYSQLKEAAPVMIKKYNNSAAKAFLKE